MLGPSGRPRAVQARGDSSLSGGRTRYAIPAAGFCQSIRGDRLRHVRQTSDITPRLRAKRRLTEDQEPGLAVVPLQFAQQRKQSHCSCVLVKIVSKVGETGARRTEEGRGGTRRVFEKEKEMQVARSVSGRFAGGGKYEGRKAKAEKSFVL